MALMRQLPMLVAARVLVLGLAACGGGYGKSKKTEEGTTTTIAGVQAKSHGTKDVSGETG
jgi:ABC-type glycerol-3-phosphate transport system substrate-binding protein